MRKKLLICFVVFNFLVNFIAPGKTMEMAKAASHDSNLGIANDFNVFVFNNHYHSSSDSEGRVAVGNEAKYSNYGIGDKLPSSTDRYDLIVGKKIDITGGTNFAGKTAIGTGGNVVNYTMTNNNGLQTPIVEDVIDFNAAYAELKNKATAWSQLTPNGTVENYYGQLRFIGTSEELNIFSVTTDQLTGIHGINFIVPDSSTVLVNVSGTSLSTGNMQIFHNGSAATTNNAGKWMWNFPNLQSLDLKGMSIYGSILAPDCTFTPSGSGNFNGTVVFQNFYNEMNGGYEAHYYPFTSTLPVSDEDSSSKIGSIEIYKVDAADYNPLAGAEFTLSQNGQVVQTATTGDDGKITFTNLPYGTYELQETKAPEGYQIAENVKVFTINDEQKEYSFTFTNEKTPEEKGSIEVTKVDELTKKPLTGAEFSLYQNGHLVQSIVTDENGKALFTDLDYGAYELKETKAPEGYKLSLETKNVIIDKEHSLHSILLQML